MTVDSIIIAFAGTMFTIVLALVAFIFSRFTKNLDSLREGLERLKNDVVHELGQLGETLKSIEKDLRKDLTSLDRRVTRVETQFSRRDGNHLNGGDSP